MTMSQGKYSALPSKLEQNIYVEISWENWQWHLILIHSLILIHHNKHHKQFSVCFVFIARVDHSCKYFYYKASFACFMYCLACAFLGTLNNIYINENNTLLQNFMVIDYIFEGMKEWEEVKEQRTVTLDLQTVWSLDCMHPCVCKLLHSFI